MLASTISDHIYIVSNSADYDNGGVLATQPGYQPSELLSDGRLVVDLHSGGAANLTPQSAPERDALFSGDGFVSAELITVDPASVYQFDAISYHRPESSSLRLSYDAYDRDQHRIAPVHVNQFPGSTDTKLVQAIQDGDTSILVADASGWSNEGSAQNRALAWYGYASNDGTVYDNYSYTRNVIGDSIHGAWAAGGIVPESDSGSYRIHLSQPWSGGPVAKGTAIRNAVANYDRFGLDSTRYNTNGRPDVWVGFDRGRYPYETLDVTALIGGRVPWNPQSITQQPLPPGTERIELAANNVVLRSSLRMLRDGQSDTASIDTMVATFDGKPTLVATQSMQWFASDQTFPIDADQSYTLGAFADVFTSADQATSVETHSLGYRAWDIDGLEILPEHVRRYVGSADTTLAKPLTPGDTTIVLSDARGWSNTNNDPATRSLAWFGYTSAAGTSYPDYTYTRNTATDLVDGLWSMGGRVGNTITLNQPWSGPSLPSGTAVRNAVAGDDGLQSVLVDGGTLSVDGSRITSSPIAGTWTDGTASTSAFPPGTAWIRLAGRINESNLTGDDIVSISAFSIGRGPESIVTPDPESHRYALILDVTENDPAVTDAGFVIDAVGQANFGTVALQTDGTILYTSRPYFVGVDHFMYTVTHPVSGEQITENVSVTILGTNASSDPDLLQAMANNPDHVAIRKNIESFDDTWNSYRVLSGQRLTVEGVRYPDLLSNDGYAALRSDRALSTYLVQPPANGSMDLAADGTFVYQSRPGFVGTDSFTYAVFDGLRVETAVASVAVYESATELVEANFQVIAAGMLNYQDVYKGYFPVAQTANKAYFDADGAPLLSWRVHLLPMLGYRELYNRFHLDEPWDSPHNLSLLPLLPAIYSDGTEADTDAGSTTRIQTITSPPYSSLRQYGETGFIEGKPETHLFDLIDGANNTIMFLQTGEDRAVDWTKPADAAFDDTDPIATVGQIASDGFPVAMFDASVYRLPASIDTDVFAALATRRGTNSEPLIDPGTVVRQAAFDNGGTGAIERLDEQMSRQDKSLRALAIAMQNHFDIFNSYAPRLVSGENGTMDENGNAYLSWRVFVLPFLGYENLYSQFHLNEPWDSPHNLSLLDHMPDLFRSKGDQATSTTTRFQVIQGPGAAYDHNADGSDRVPNKRDFKDGEQNTLMIVESGIDRAVPWTQPSEFVFDPDDPLASLGSLPEGFFRAILADGTTLKLSKDLAAEAFVALATRDGGEVQDPMTLRRLYADLNAPETELDTASRMKQVALGLHNFHDVYGRFPLLDIASYFDADNQPLLSWRVHLLPYIGQSNLYTRFNLDEPWDSENNLPLAQLMPDVYRSLGDPWDSITTRFQSFVDDGALFSSTGPGPRLRDIADGTANTILFVESGADTGVVWTKPQDLAFDRNDPLASLGAVGEGFASMFADVAFRYQYSSLSREVMNRLIQSSDGSIVDLQKDTIASELDWDRSVISEGELGRIAVLQAKGTFAVSVDDPDLLSVYPDSLSFDGDLSGLTQSITFKAADNAQVDQPRVTTIHIGDYSFDVTVLDNDVRLGLYDYGDAPSMAISPLAASYPVAHADNGARHWVGPLFLGNQIDVDFDGTPSDGALADDTTDRDDEDGVEFSTTLITSADTDTASSVYVTASAAGKLDGWIDWNRDGDWDDAQEQVFVSRAIQAGGQILSLDLPAAVATPGITFARFRLSSAGGLGPSGEALDGEVEDYAVTVRDGDAVASVNAQIDLVANVFADIFAEDGALVIHDGTKPVFRSPGSALESLAIKMTDQADTIHLANIDSIFSGLLRLDAGQGDDQLVLTGQGHDLDLTLLADDAIQNLERLDIRGSGVNRLALSSVDLLAATDANHELTLVMDSDDRLDIDGVDFDLVRTEVVDGKMQLVVQGGEATLNIQGTGWTHPLNRFDANNDRTVSPLDALIVLNQLERRDYLIESTAALVDPADVALFPGRFYDVTGEGWLTPIDALQILNYIHRENASGEATIDTRWAAASFAAPPIESFHNDTQDEPIRIEPETMFRS